METHVSCPSADTAPEANLKTSLSIIQRMSFSLSFPLAAPTPLSCSPIERKQFLLYSFYYYFLFFSSFLPSHFYSLISRSDPMTVEFLIPTTTRLPSPLPSPLPASFPFPLPAPLPSPLAAPLQAHSQPHPHPYSQLQPHSHSHSHVHSHSK